MTIPQLENEIRVLIERLDKSEAANESIRENITELRQQLGVDRLPGVETPRNSPVMNSAVAQMQRR